MVNLLRVKKKVNEWCKLFWDGKKMPVTNFAPKFQQMPKHWNNSENYLRELLMERSNIKSARTKQFFSMPLEIKRVSAVHPEINHFHHENDNILY